MECYTPADVARILKISKSQSYNLFNSHIPGEEFRSFQVGKNWRIEKTDFEAWISSKPSRTRR